MLIEVNCLEQFRTVQDTQDVFSTTTEMYRLVLASQVWSDIETQAVLYPSGQGKRKLV